MATVPRVQGIALHWTEARVSPATDSPVTVTQRLLFRSGSRITSLGITIHITFVCVIPECFSESLGAGWDWVYSVCQPLFGLLHQPQMIDNVWSRWWKKNWQGKQQYLEKISPSATLSTTNSIWSDLVHCGEKLVTNHLSYGTAGPESPICKLCAMPSERLQYLMAETNFRQVAKSILSVATSITLFSLDTWCVHIPFCARTYCGVWTYIYTWIISITKLK